MPSVIAERELGYSHSGLSERGRIFFEAPEPGDRCWHCRYEIDLPGFVFRRNVAGADSLQALQIAMQSAASEIALSEPFKSGHLTVFGEKVATTAELKKALGVSVLYGDYH